MAYSGLPNGDITWASNELVTSAKMNLFSANQTDMSNYLETFDPNDGTLTISVNGTPVATFTADDVSDVTADIPVPTKVADLTDAASYALASSIPTKVSDLTNDAGYVTSSAITQVNDATLSIKRNNVEVGEFSANADTDATVNIVVPTNVSDLSDASNYYTKNQTNDAIATAIGSVTQQTVNYEIVQVLPTTGISTSTVYMVKEGTNTYYDQWMYINNAWAHLGTTEVDMSAYAKKSEIPVVPTVGDGIIRIVNHDGTLVDSFSVNQTTGTTITLPSPLGTLDTALDPNSTNAVQNKAIANAIKNSTITLKDVEANTLGSFTTNQASSSDITIPTASASNYGLVKVVTSTTDIGEGAALAEGTIYCVVSA